MRIETMIKIPIKKNAFTYQIGASNESNMHIKKMVFLNVFNPIFEFLIEKENFQSKLFFTSTKLHIDVGTPLIFI